MRCRIILCCFLVLFQGCTTFSLIPEPSFSSEEGICLKWLESIEAKLEEYEISDPGTVKITGFPQLRVNRFLASFSSEVKSDHAYAAWLERMRIIDAKNKVRMLGNLPKSERMQLLTKIPTGGNFDQAIAKCGKRLNDYTFNHAANKKIILEHAKVPDSYQDWKRVIGGYPIARYLATFAINRLHRELNASFKVSINELPVIGQLIRYSPPSNKPLLPDHISSILNSAYDSGNPLGIPILSDLERQELFQHFAPVWEIDTRNDNDKVGMINFDKDSHPKVDISQPTVYTALGYARWHGKVLLQLIYQIWLPAREKTGFFDLYGGPLDSVIWRITLTPEGTPMAFDSIHACGCYYLLFPGQGYRAIPPMDDAEPVLSPKHVTENRPGSRLLLRLESRTHYLQQVSSVNETFGNSSLFYQYQNLEELRSLSLPTGAKLSVYDEDGLIDASARAERFLLWPFGIISPGAMREWGTHAISFIGKRHFDDPFLLEQLLDKE